MASAVTPPPNLAPTSPAPAPISPTGLIPIPVPVRPSDDERYLRELWSAFVAVVIYQNNPSYGIEVMRSMQRQVFANSSQRIVWSRSQMALSEWVRVWEAAWLGMPVEWKPAKVLLGDSLDVIIDPMASVRQGEWVLYRSIIVPADYTRTPVAVMSSLTTAFCWKNLAYWASLPKRIRMEVYNQGPIAPKDLDRICDAITQKILPDVLFLYRSLPIWKGWLP